MRESRSSLTFSLPIAVIRAIMNENTHRKVICMAPLISKIPLEVTMVGDNTKGTVPAGTEFTFLRSDGDTYAEFRLPDGRECRVTRDNGETWPYTVNGVTEEECFDGLGYAG